MSAYVIPEIVSPVPVASDEVLLVANGDLRQSANEVCWPAQSALEQMLTEAFQEEEIKLRRAHPYNPTLKHGFINGQRMGMQVFEHIHPDAPSWWPRPCGNIAAICWRALYRIADPFLPSPIGPDSGPGWLEC